MFPQACANLKGVGKVSGGTQHWIIMIKLVDNTKFGGKDSMPISYIIIRNKLLLICERWKGFGPFILSNHIIKILAEKNFEFLMMKWFLRSQKTSNSKGVRNRIANCKFYFHKRMEKRVAACLVNILANHLCNFIIRNIRAFFVA